VTVDTKRFTVDPQEVEAWIREVPRAERSSLLDALFEFGQMKMEGARDHTDAIDSKAVAIVGWSSAMVAFLVSILMDGPQSWVWVHTAATVVACAALVSAAVAVWLAWSAHAPRQWRSPSTRDWFERDYFDDVSTLRTFHVVQMLKSVQSTDAQNDQKGTALWRAQLAQLVATGATISLVVFRLFVFR
jgi:hypothetical protein